MHISPMNLSTSFQQLFRPKKPQKELYLSLTLSHSHIGACAWSMDSDGTLMVAAAESKKLGKNTWEHRIEIADQLIEKLSEYAGTDAIHQVVFGLSQDMLTTSGDIEKGVKLELKKLSTMLDLTPVGFVNIDTAVVFQIKHDEGVPPSVILLHVQGEELLMSLYRVGTCVGSRSIQKTEFIVEDVETAIKSFSDIEVLPSRILLFGDDTFALEAIQSQLLTHQWPNRVNFLHYPKIDVMPMEDVARAVALAGASELASAMGIDNEEQEDALSEAKSRHAGGEKTVVAQPEEVKPTDDKDMVEEIDDAFNKDMDTEAAPSHEASAGEEKLEEIEIRPEDANVVAVSPEVLGFGKNEKVSKIKKVLTNIHIQIPQIPKIPIHGIALPLGIIGIIIVGLLGLLYYFLPKVTITIGVIPQIITKEKAVTIATSATGVDEEKFIVPGKKQEKSITGEKTIPVVGKKKIGDPARGTVTLYNKTKTATTLKKGTVIEYKSLEFTLDSDVEVASASENMIQSTLTYGTTPAVITALAIGEEGNVAANSEFSVKGYDTNVLIARNGQPFTGGTSREATVVSRADYDNLIKTLTDELVLKAKEELSQEVTGGEKLIEQTIKTTVANKSFTEELDQEAKELHGKATITVTGISYKEDDIKTLLLTLASKDIQSGYIVNEGRTITTVVSPVLKKDGSITAQASIRLVSIPKIEVEMVRKSLVRKSFTSAQELLKQIQGVGSAEFVFKPSLGNKMLPLKATNITIDVVIVE